MTAPGNGEVIRCRLHVGVRPQTILFLCEESEETARPWREGGYSVICVDLAVDGQDVRLLQVMDILGLCRKHALRIAGVFAMPPCTHLAKSGARWWAGKGEKALLDALSVVDACLRIGVALIPHGLQWFALENPSGRLTRSLGKPVMTFHPCHFGDPYTKLTCLWGWGFNTQLPRNEVAPTLGSKMHFLAPTPQRPRLRSVTPPGFARAFYLANAERAA